MTGAGGAIGGLAGAAATKSPAGAAVGAGLGAAAGGAVYDAAASLPTSPGGGGVAGRRNRLHAQQEAADLRG